MWGLVRTGRPVFNVVLVSLRLNAGNYGREKRLGRAERPSKGGRAHTQQGGESCHRRDQSSVKQSPDPRPQFSGKRLGCWFRAPQLHGLVETLFCGLKGGTQHGGIINANVHTRKHMHSHSLSRFLFLSLTKKKQLGGGLQQPYYHSNSISHIWAQIKTLWIFIFPVNRSSLIERSLSMPKEWFYPWTHVDEGSGNLRWISCHLKKWNIINTVSIFKVKRRNPASFLSFQGDSCFQLGRWPGKKENLLDWGSLL